MEQLSQTRRIALIDDDPITNMINKKIIALISTHYIIDYTNAQAALAQFKAWSNTAPDQLPDIIFLDINMPVMDGWEFLEEFQKFPPQVFEKCKVYMLTSSIDADDIQKSKSYRVVKDFISKPLTVEKIKTLIAV